MTSIKEIGENLTRAGKLEARPLCIYGSETIPEHSIPSTKLHFCISNAMISLAMRKDIRSIYYGLTTRQGSCPGARAWLGYERFNPFLHYFLSTGIKDISSEFLVINPEIALERINSIGKITPLGKFTIIRACEDVSEENLNVKAIVCFGSAEQIRNLSMLVYFESKTPFGMIQIPWGSSCSSFITYPAGLTEKNQNDYVVLGPIDPTDNYFFPPNLLAMGIPVKLAIKMSENLEKSFIVKRAEVAYPTNRSNPIDEFSEKSFKEFSERLFKKHDK